jgi:hypothetical protein
MMILAPSVYRQAMTEAVNNLQFLGFKVRFLKPAYTTHPDKAMAKVSLSSNLYLNSLSLLSMSISI